VTAPDRRFRASSGVAVGISGEVVGSESALVVPKRESEALSLAWRFGLVDRALRGRRWPTSARQEHEIAILGLPRGRDLGMALSVRERPVRISHAEYRPASDREDGDHTTGRVRIAVRSDELPAPLGATPLGMVERGQRNRAWNVRIVDADTDRIRQRTDNVRSLINRAVTGEARLANPGAPLGLRQRGPRSCCLFFQDAQRVRGDGSRESRPAARRELIRNLAPGDVAEVDIPLHCRDSRRGWIADLPSTARGPARQSS
jgi:hypothetical protein